MRYKLIDGFMHILAEKVNVRGAIEHKVGNFGDYGYGDVLPTLTVLSLMLKDEDYQTPQVSELLHSYLFNPELRIRSK